MNTIQTLRAIGHILIDDFKGGLGSLENINWALNNAVLGAEASEKRQISTEEKQAAMVSLIRDYAVA